MSVSGVARRIKMGVEGMMPFSNFDKPIFIISPPRSGSTYLFECMIQINGLFHMSHESDFIWWRHFPVSRLNEPSDYVGEEDASVKNIYKFKRALRSRICSYHMRTRWRAQDIAFYLGVRPICFIDKTIANCFHLEFLERAFPDAQYIFLLRDPRAVINSMIDGWNETFRKPQLQTHIDCNRDAKIPHWAYPAAPGWNKLIAEPLSQICAWSWRQHIEYPMAFFEKYKKQCQIVRYENLVSDPISVFERLQDGLYLPNNGKKMNRIRTQFFSSTTVSNPEPNKWKTRRRGEIESVLPGIYELSKHLGYDVYSD